MSYYYRDRDGNVVADMRAIVFGVATLGVAIIIVATLVRLAWSVLQVGMDRTIYPTHTCFDDALDLMMAILKENRESPDDVKASLRDDLYLVHGVTMITGKPSAHAWVEYDFNNTALFVGILDGKRENFSAPREEYYRELQVIEHIRYHYAEVLVFNHMTGHYGPWNERYKTMLRAAPQVDAYKIDRIGPL